MMNYNPQKIEPKWQLKWEKLGLDKAKDFDKKPKRYILVEFPYLSGDGLHVGHVRSYSALDAVVRKKRMEGYNVLYPIGWDAFGLPTENYAIKTGIHPIEITKNNIKLFKRQIKSLGLSFDWSREINTSDPEYYKWTQWIFLQMFKKGLAYKKKMPINWCPSCKIGLANEEVIGGKCERCETEVEVREKEQWMLRITKYADRLLKDLEKVDYSERIKTQQINWIGKSRGVEIDFSGIKVFTTRSDTILGATFLVLSPDHPKNKTFKNPQVKKYITKARAGYNKEKTGVFSGEYAINPATQEKIPIWIADYVLMEYGTGAIMAVPDCDERDKEFAKKYNLKIKKTKLVDSEEIVKKIKGKWRINYHLRDWIFSRQHYWGEPIPIIHCQKCGAMPVPEKDLPVKLPYVKKYKPTTTGESPLAIIKEWVNVKCPECKGSAKRETDTMPNWAGSNWYYLAYIMRGNPKFEIRSPKLYKYWLPVDLYNGGMEHTTLHLLYSRFWHKFLYDIEVVPTSEPYAKRRSHGMVLASDGRKMSKSFGNVINPDEVIKGYGADSLRLYEMFMGPFEEAINWSTKGLEGCYRFLKRVWVLFNNKKKISKETNKDLAQKLHYTIKKVGDDLENMKFNTAVAAMMEFVNLWQEKDNKLSIKDAENFLKILAPFCPHICEEIWQSSFAKASKDKKDSIFFKKWPKYDEKLIKKQTFELVVQVNGRVRSKIEVPSDISRGEAEKVALTDDKVKKWLAGKKPKVVIFVKGKLINIVV
jgi:leucyl-tRNA synthetase